MQAGRILRQVFQKRGYRRIIPVHHLTAFSNLLSGVTMRFVVRAVFVVVLGMSAFGQSDRGTITGTVADPAGAVVPNAPVEAKNVETGAVYQAGASATGNFTLAQLPTGTYQLSVTVPGFKKYVRTNILLQVAQTIRADVTLEVG